MTVRIEGESGGPTLRKVAVVLLAVGAVGLAVLVLVYHRADLDRSVAVLRALSPLLVQRGVSLPVVAESAAGAVVAALIVVSWYSAGTVLGWLVRLEPVRERWRWAAPVPWAQASGLSCGSRWGWLVATG